MDIFEPNRPDRTQGSSPPLTPAPASGSQSSSTPSPTLDINFEALRGQTPSPLKATPLTARTIYPSPKRDLIDHVSGSVTTRERSGSKSSSGKAASSDSIHRSKRLATSIDFKMEPAEDEEYHSEQNGEAPEDVCKRLYQTLTTKRSSPKAPTKRAITLDSLVSLSSSPFKRSSSKLSDEEQKLFNDCLILLSLAKSGRFIFYTDNCVEVTLDRLADLIIASDLAKRTVENYPNSEFGKLLAALRFETAQFGTVVQELQEIIDMLKHVKKYWTKLCEIVETTDETALTKSLKITSVNEIDLNYIDIPNEILIKAENYIEILKTLQQTPEDIFNPESERWLKSLGTLSQIGRLKLGIVDRFTPVLTCCINTLLTDETIKQKRHDRWLDRLKNAFPSESEERRRDWSVIKRLVYKIVKKQRNLKPDPNPE